MMRFAVLTGLFGTLTLAAPAAAETKVELKSVHMCCGGCAKEVASILKKVDGVQDVQCDQETTTARFIATDAKAAQRALDALADGGFHGDTNGAKEYGFRDDSGAKAGKVKKLTVTGFHNSCPGCVKSFREAIKDVPGVAGDTAKSKVSTCAVTGDFDPAALVKALNKAGFHVKVQE
jgi:periplasmic mercuric ion binding protein